MINPISPNTIPHIVDSIGLNSRKPGAVAGEAAASADFGEMFEQAVERVERFQLDSRQKVDQFLRGEDQELHEIVLAGQRSEVAFEYFLQVRNKLVQAYQEVMRMQM
jgi:flagellar hook-basal body complex protein FliE